MDEEQTKEVNTIAADKFKKLLEQCKDELPTIEEEIQIMGECYGIMLFLEMLGYNVKGLAKDAKSGIEKLKGMVEDE
jgi:hypothetical protein